ncbi:MAG: hypothetical protein IPI81_17550 [Flavobacteriales bacterium]|nr:hypothetical protein [Flavobacteriales bacterium]
MVLLAIGGSGGTLIFFPLGEAGDGMVQAALCVEEEERLARGLAARPVFSTGTNRWIIHGLITWDVQAADDTTDPIHTDGRSCRENISARSAYPYPFWYPWWWYGWSFCIRMGLHPMMASNISSSI